MAAQCTLYRLAGYPSNGVFVGSSPAGHYLDGAPYYNKITSRGNLLATSVGLNRGAFNYGFDTEVPISLASMKSGVGIFSVYFDLHTVYRLSDVKITRGEIVNQSGVADETAGTVYVDTPRTLFRNEAPYYHTNTALLKPRVFPVSGVSVSVAAENGAYGVKVKGIDLLDIWPYGFTKAVNVSENQKLLDTPTIFAYNSSTYILMEARYRIYEGGRYGFAGPFLRPASSFTPTHIGIVIPDDYWTPSWTQPGPTPISMTANEWSVGEEIPLTFPHELDWDPLTYKSEILNRLFSPGVGVYSEPVVMAVAFNNLVEGEGSVTVPLHVSWNEVS